MADIDLKTVSALQTRDNVANVVVEYTDGGQTKLGKASLAAFLGGLVSEADHASLMDRVLELEAAAGDGPLTAMPNGTEFVIFGDSMTQRASSATFYIASTGANDSVSSSGAIGWAKTLLKQRIRFRPELNLGVAGTTTGPEGGANSMIARLPDVLSLATKNRAVTFLGGTNDLNSKLAVAQTTANYTTILDALRAAYGWVFVQTVAPRSNWPSTFSSQDISDAKAKIIEFNEFLSQYCARHTSSCVYVDFYQDWIDATSGGPKSGYTDEGTHQTGLGAYYWGKRLRDGVSAILVPGSSIWPLHAGFSDQFDGASNPFGNKVSDAIASLNGGTTALSGNNMSGVKATGFDVSFSSGSSATNTGSGVGSVNAVDGVNRQVIDWTARTGGQENLLATFRVYLSGGKYGVGEKIVGAIAYKATGLSNVANLQLTLSDYPGTNGTTQTAAGQAPFSSVNPGATEDQEGIILTAPHIIQSTTGTGTPFIAFNVVLSLLGAQSGGSSGHLELWLPTIRRADMSLV